MIANSAFQAIKNNLINLNDWLLLVELRYDTGDETTPESSRLYFRAARSRTPISYEHDSFTPFAAKVWTPMSIGTVKQSQDMTGTLPTFELAISNVDRQMQTILQRFIIEHHHGRVIYAHPDHLNDDTAKLEEKFTVVSVVTNRQVAKFTLTSVAIDPLTLAWPWKIVTFKLLPGILGNRAFAR